MDRWEMSRQDINIIIFAISITRFESIKAKKILEKKGITAGIVNIVWLKPFKIKKRWLEALKKSRFGGIVIDDDYVNGVSKSVANDLNLKTRKQMHTMGLNDRTAGFHKKSDNLPPDAEKICKQVEKIIISNFS